MTRNRRTGNPLGRPVIYSDDDERPVTISLRVPHDLAEQAKRYAARRRQSVTELLLDGLKWRISEGDPSGLGTALPQHQPPHDNEYFSNTEIRHDDSAQMALLEEMRGMLADLKVQLEGLPETPDFDPEKFGLGSLCKRGHNYKETGKTLKRLKDGKPVGVCVLCHRMLSNPKRPAESHP